MTDQQTPRPGAFETAGETGTPARRRLLAALVGVGGAYAAGKSLPERWTRPVVDTVLLPAHAQATGFRENYSGQVNPVASSGPGPAVLRGLLDFVVPPAHATALPITTATLCVKVDGIACKAKLLLSNVNGCAIFSGNGTAGGSSFALNGSSSVYSDVMLEVPAVNSAGLSYNLAFEQYGTPFSDSGSISAGNCAITGNECNVSS